MIFESKEKSQKMIFESHPKKIYEINFV